MSPFLQLYHGVDKYGLAASWLSGKLPSINSHSIAKPDHFVTETYFDVDTLIQDVADPDNFDADTQWQDTVDPCPAFCVKQLFLPKTNIVSVSLHLSLYQRFTLQMQLISKTVESFSVSP